MQINTHPDRQEHPKGKRCNLEDTLASHSAKLYPRARIQWIRKVGPSTCTSVGNSHVMREYIGKTSRTLRERHNKHLRDPSPFHVHSTQTGHSTSPEIFNIIGREDHGLTRTIKESMYVRINNPTFIGM